jgi:hypothetical protein
MPDVVMRCPRCGKKLQKDVPCICLTPVETAPPPPPAPVKAPSAAKGKSKPIRKTTVVLAVIAVAGLGVVAWNYMPRTRYPNEIQLTRWKGDPGIDAAPSDPCLGRSRCVVVYLMPMSNPCYSWLKKTLPQLRKAWKEPDRPGLRVIIGTGEAPALDPLARLVGDPVYLDTTGAFKEDMRIDVFPKFYVVDPTNRILESGRNAGAWIESENHP